MKCFLDGHVHVNCDLKILCAFLLFNKTSRCADLVGKPNFKYQDEKPCYRQITLITPQFKNVYEYERKYNNSMYRT